MLACGIPLHEQDLEPCFLQYQLCSTEMHLKLVTLATSFHTSTCPPILLPHFLCKSSEFCGALETAVKLTF